MDSIAAVSHEKKARVRAIRWIDWTLQHYPFAIASVALALGVGLLAGHYGVRHVQFTVFLFAIAVTAWYGGRGNAMLAVLMAGLAYAYFFAEPIGFAVSRENLPHYVLFILFGILIGWFGAVRRQAEEILRQRASLLDLTHDTVFVRDMQDVITYWNRGAEELYGWSRQEAVGQVTHQLTRTIFPAPLAEINAQLLRTGRWEGELIHTTRDGTQVVVASRWSLQYDERGNPSAILETNNDVTETKKAEEALLRSRDELEVKVKERTADLQSVNKELEAFAYSVSHDLRAPVRHIAGFTELLQKHAGPALDDKSRRHITMILESANRMGSLVDDLLAFSRIGRAETQNTTIHLDELVKGVVDEISPDTENRNIAWSIGTLPVCYGDPSMLRLVFGNLISNAVKFTRPRPASQIEIGSINHQPNEVIVFIKDNGVGFDMKYRDKLFGVFQRLHSQEAFEGTGIGLATVERVVHRHGGRVWAESSVDHGATFFVALPKPERSPHD
ncbi:MAG TPA: ATP-binding protein [Chthoniobacterales bacterium]|nr:ATP-binding protein [Chthoniobacterales bacterium]